MGSSPGAIDRPIMESPPFNVGQEDEDSISALPDHLLVGILERLDLRTAIRAGVVSTRWRHLPHQLTRLRLKARHFHGTPVDQIMTAYTGALSSLLSPPACGHGNCSRAIKTIRLSFYVSDPQMSSIGRAVEDVVSRGETESLKFSIVPPPDSSLLAKFGQQFMSFSRAYPVAFRWLTTLTLMNLTFGDSDIADLIRACDKLRHLYLGSCRLVDRHSALKIDTPCSGLRKLMFSSFHCTRIELISVPKLRSVWCYSWRGENPPVLFGDVPKLRKVLLASHATASQAPFALSECLSTSARNLSKLHLSFCCQRIWIRPEHPRKLTGIFSNLKDVHFSGIFPECDLSWTMFILEAASYVTSFTISRTRHSCVKKHEDNIAEKTNVVWEPSKDFKHFNLKLLVMEGFEEEGKVINYVRLVMERVVGLKRIKLYGNTCEGCNAIDQESTRSQVDEASRHRVRNQLTNGSASSVEIIIC